MGQRSKRGQGHPFLLRTTKQVRGRVEIKLEEWEREVHLGKWVILRGGVQRWGEAREGHLLRQRQAGVP